jgi:TatA/E family protein of Tat protein translocase
MLSIPHMIVVFVIVLVVFGPQKLPELARGLGKLMAEFRKASTDFKSAFEEEMRDLERQAREVERRKAEAATAAASSAAQTQPATLATPSGVETEAGSGALAEAGATEGSIPAETGAEGAGPVVAPVAEGNVARERETEAPNAEQARADGNGTVPAETPELQAKAQKADT